MKPFTNLIHVLQVEFNLLERSLQLVTREMVHWSDFDKSWEK